MEGLDKMAKSVKSAVTVLPYTAAANIEQIIAEHQGTAPDFTLPEGWDDAMVEAHILSCETIEMDKKLAEEGLAMFHLPSETRETPENLIVPAGLLGAKERWFIKKNLKAVTKADDGNGFWIIASKRQLKDRGLSV